MSIIRYEVEDGVRNEYEVEVRVRTGFELLGFGRNASDRLELGGIEIVFDSEIVMYVGEACILVF